MTPDEIPQELLDILNERAGKVHPMQCLAEILTKYDEMNAEQDRRIMELGGLPIPKYHSS